MPNLTISPTLHINYTIHPPTQTPSAAAPKPWIVLVNGLADPQTTWAAQLPAFTAAGYTVLTYDNRGVGQSSRAGGDGEVYTAEDMAADLRSLVTAPAVGVPTPYHLLGVSMGGMIAQTYALRCPPSELASLTLACTYAWPGPFCARMFALWRDVAQSMSVAAVMRDVALWAFTPEFFSGTREEDVQAMEAEMARIDDDMGLRSYLAQLNVITTFDTRREVGRLGTGTGGDGQRSAGGPPRVIVLAGESDILIPVALSRELARLIAGSMFRTTRGGHACMWEFPDEFNRACLEGWREAEQTRS